MTSSRNAQLQATLAALQIERDALISSIQPLLAKQPTHPPPHPQHNDSPAQPAPPTCTDSIATEVEGVPIEAEQEQVIALAHEVVKRHIALLGRYNKTRDAGQSLMGLIAEQRGVRVAEVMDELGIDVRD